MFTIATTVATSSSAPPSKSLSSPRSHRSIQSTSPRIRNTGTSSSQAAVNTLSSTTRQVATAVVRAAFSQTRQEQEEKEQLFDTPTTLHRPDSRNNNWELETTLNASDLSIVSPSVHVQVCPAVLVITAPASVESDNKPQKAKKSTTSNLNGTDKHSSRVSEKPTKPFVPPSQPFQSMSAPRFSSSTGSSSPLLLLSSDRDRMRLESELKVALEQIAAVESDRQRLQALLEQERQTNEETSKQQQVKIAALEEQLNVDHNSHRTAIHLLETRLLDQLRQSKDDHQSSWSNRERVWLTEKVAHDAHAASKHAALEEKHAAAIALRDERLQEALGVHQQSANQCAQLRRQVEEQEAQLQISRHRCDTQLQILATCRAQMLSLKQSAVELRADMESQRHSIADEVASMQNSTVAAVDAVRQRAENIIETRSTLDQDRITSLQTQVEALTRSLRSSQEESQRQQDECTKLKAELARSSKELQHSEHRHSATQQRVVSLETRVNQQATELDKLRGEESSAAESRIRLQQSLTLALDTQHKLQTQLQGRECQVARQTQQLAGQQRNLDDAKAHLRHLKEQQQHSDAAWRDQITEHHILRAECADAKRRYKQAVMSPRTVRACFHPVPPAHTHTHTYTHMQTGASLPTLSPVVPIILDVHAASPSSTTVHHFIPGTATYSTSR